MKSKSSSNPKSGSSKNLRIGVLYGGKSSERKISILSGRAVEGAFARSGFSSTPIDPAQPARMKRELARIDIAFIALHGRGGEDGTIQAELERQKIPYVGSGILGSKNAFDKALAKKKFIRSGIPTAPYVVIHQENWRTALSKFPPPFFVKPLREGSSIGAFGVEDLNDSAEKIMLELKKYGELLVEKKINGREFTVGILGKKALPVVEVVPKNSFYDYHSKYTKGMTDYRVPAPIPQRLSATLQKMARRVHAVLGLRDFSRIDIMVDDREGAYVLEANSIPGLTELSLLPKAARSAGISFEHLCCRLISFAAKRGARARKAGSYSYGKEA